MIARRLLLVGLAALCGLVASSAPAGATITHKLEFSFNGRHTPKGQFSSASLAVDRSASASAGDIYVDDDDGVIDKFDSSGKYLCQITGAGSATISPSECDSSSAGAPSGAFKGDLTGVAVDPASGELYVVDAAHNAVLRFSSTGAYETEITGLTSPKGVAVDGVSGDVYIAETGNGPGEAKVLKYDPATAILSTFATGTTSGPFGPFPSSGLAVDGSLGATAGDVYVADGGAETVDRFSPSGAFEMQLSLLSAPSGGPEASEPNGVAVDPTTGRTYVAILGGAVDEYASSGELAGQLSGFPSTVNSVALSAGGRLYVSAEEGSQEAVDIFGPDVVVPDVTTGSAVQVGASGATLEGSVNPDGIQLSDCRFVYGPETFYGQSAPCEPAAGSIAADSTSHGVTARLTGLRPGVTYHYRLEAANANGSNAGSDQTFVTLPAPSIDSASAANLSAGSVDLQAQIDPNGYDTSYYFEYGTSTAYGTRIPVEASEDSDIGAGTNDVSVSVHLSELHANKETYHWRVVATNANGTVGEDHTFVYPTGGAELPDKRAYELVTPPHKNASLLDPTLIFGLPPAVSEDGTRVMTIAIQCFANAESCSVSKNGALGSPYESSRTGDGWQTTALSPPVSQLSESSTLEYNPNNGTSVFAAPTEPHGEEDYYLRREEGAFVDIGPITPPTNGNLPESSKLVSSADATHFVFGLNKPAWPFDGTKSTGKSIYEYSGTGNSQPLLIGVTGGQGSTDLVSSCATSLPEEGVGDDISADGRTVLFIAERCESGGTGANHGIEVPASELYARVDGERSDAHTVLISQRSSSNCNSSCQESAPASAEFTSASSDGSKVVFTSTQRLTDDASEDQKNVYLYDFDSQAGHELIDASAGDTSGSGSQVLGVLAVSQDGSHVYFAARGVLTGAPNSQGQRASEGRSNLYVYERDQAHPEGKITFIADASVPLGGPVGTGEGVDRSNVTPDGRYLVFTSASRLTPDDTGTNGAHQVFRYDAQTDELLRISVGNEGFNDDGNRSYVSSCPSKEPECESAHIVTPGYSVRRDPTMSNDGSYVFFESPVGLTPQAQDLVQVGQEPEGVGAIYAENVYEWHAGHIYLISDGRDSGLDASQSADLCGSLVTAICLLGSDASGHNVFFSTIDKLVPEDTDTQLDYYDARICTEAEPCIKTAPPALPPCLGEACHGTPVGTPPAPGVPSMTFSGQGDLVSAPTTTPRRVVVKKVARCRKGKVRVRGRCTKKKAKPRVGSGRKTKRGRK